LFLFLKHKEVIVSSASGTHGSDYHEDSSSSVLFRFSTVALSLFLFHDRRLTNATILLLGFS
jgi:hypothetical protein